eukprot:9515172-Karenia_brevis.AAC.1
MGLKDNRFNDEDEDDEDKESSSNNITPRESRPPIGAPKDYKAEAKEEIKNEPMQVDERNF